MNINRRRYRFIERDYLFNKMKNTSKNQTDDQINSMLDKNSQWCDLTFIFTINSYGISTIIIDNNTECDVALADLNGNAKQFYHNMVRKLSNKDVFEYIKNILGNKKVV